MAVQPGNLPIKTPSYLIPLGDLSLPERAGKRREIDQHLMAAAINASIRLDPSEYTVRDTLPSTDLAITGPAAIANESWTIPVAGVAAAQSVYFSHVIGQNQVIGFWGVSSPMALPNVSTLSFFLGGTATTLVVFQLEQLFARYEEAAYFSYPLLFSKTRTARATVLARAAFPAFTEMLVLNARTIEPIGDTISTPAV